MAKVKKVKTNEVCGDCMHCSPYMSFNTLSIKGKPTMGTCPFWKTSKCILLTQPACEKFTKNPI